jgi:hypothetical protein
LAKSIVVENKHFKNKVGGPDRSIICSITNHAQFDRHCPTNLAFLVFKRYGKLVIEIKHYKEI